MNDYTELPENAPWWAKWLRANWQTIGREFSTWFIGIAAVLQLIPPDTWTALGFGDKAQRTATAISAAAALVSKFIRQPAIERKDP